VNASTPPPFHYGFPLRENCNPNNPYEAFLWMLVSKRLWDLGARPTEQPVLKYRKPSNMDANWMTSPGDWVPADTPDDDPRSPARRAADSLMPIQKAEVFRELAKDMTPKQRYEYLQAAMKEADE